MTIVFVTIPKVEISMECDTQKPNVFMLARLRFHEET